MASVESSVQPRRFVEGELFWYLGKEYPLHLVSSSTKQLRFDPARGFFLSLAQQPQASKLFTAWYRKQTRKLVNGLIAQYSKSHGFKITGVRITSARTRWGSCSAKNSLNFTYRLCMAPLAAVEYVVVHELVHTRVKNHSHKFWAGVAEILPGWKQQRAWLNTHGRKLDI
jgi:predicted metal-dependent hydrolase